MGDLTQEMLDGKIIDEDVLIEVVNSNSGSNVEGGLWCLDPRRVYAVQYNTKDIVRHFILSQPQRLLE